MYKRRVPPLYVNYVTDGNCVNSREINKFKINHAFKVVKIQNNYSLQNEGDIGQCLRRST